MTKAGNGWDEEDIIPFLLSTNLSRDWYTKYTDYVPAYSDPNGIGHPATNDIVDTLRATEQLRWSMRHIELDANTVYAQVGKGDTIVPGENDPKPTINKSANRSEERPDGCYPVHRRRQQQRKCRRYVRAG